MIFRPSLRRPSPRAKVNEYAWTVAASVLYVEQPIGVGFSEATNGTPPPTHEDDVAADFDAFLQNFYRVFRGRETEVSSSGGRDGTGRNDGALGRSGSWSVAP
jgi:carboxypeptidase C (cathepsin A)